MDNQILNLILSKFPNYSNNPMAKNAVDMAMRGDTRGLQKLAENICNQKGINLDDIKRQFKL